MIDFFIHTCARIPYAGFCQIRSHVTTHLGILAHFCDICAKFSTLPVLFARFVVEIQRHVCNRATSPN